MPKTFTITRVFRTDKDKKGNKLVNRNGKAYTKLALKVEELGDKWLSGFENQKNANWKEGDKVEIVVEENGQYLNFKMPDPVQQQENRQREMYNELRNLIGRVVKIEQHLNIDSKASAFSKPANEIPYPEDEINPDDIPF